MKIWIGAMIVLFAAAGFIYAADVTVTVNLVNAEGVGKEIGTITASDSNHGLLLTPKLNSLPPGVHGFHIHENPSCAPAKKDDKMVAAQAAGAHLDPDKQGKHNGPYKAGHKGDVPVLIVDADGTSTLPVLAPRLKTSDLTGRSLMIHAGSDNYSDQPKPLGGGGDRIACGVVK